MSRERNSIALQRFAKSHVAPNSHDSSGLRCRWHRATTRARTQAFVAPAFVPRAATHTHVGARGRCCLVHPDPAVPSSLLPSLALSLFFSESSDFLPYRQASLGRPRPSLPLPLGSTSLTAPTSGRENINSLKPTD